VNSESRRLACYVGFHLIDLGADESTGAIECDYMLMSVSSYNMDKKYPSILTFRIIDLTSSI